MEKKIKDFPGFVSMEMMAVLDFRALAKVHIKYYKPLVEMQ